MYCAHGTARTQQPAVVMCQAGALKVWYPDLSISVTWELNGNAHSLVPSQNY